MKKELQPISPAFPLELTSERWQATFGYDLPPEMLFVTDQNRRNFIELGDATQYPIVEPTTRPDPISDLLLKSTYDGGVMRLLLPDNSVTLATALNEASGSGSDRNGETRELFTHVFDNLTASLGLLATKHGLLPDRLSYDQILIVKRSAESRILPPLALVPVTGNKFKGSWEDLRSSFLDSMAAGAQTDEQRVLYGSFRAMINKSFSKGLK